jgi:hypothetical protein
VVRTAAATLSTAAPLHSQRTTYVLAQPLTASSEDPAVAGQMFRLP